jgi:hypothetical protein
MTGRPVTVACLERRRSNSWVERMWRTMGRARVRRGRRKRRRVRVDVMVF